MEKQRSVDADVVLLLLMKECIVPVDCALSYSPADPYAVTMALRLGSEPEVVWTVSRELLAEGTSTLAGHGDIRLWPAESPDGPLMCLVLGGSPGRALLEARLDEMEWFLDQTYAVVPLGTETDLLDLDAELAAITEWDC